MHVYIYIYIYITFCRKAEAKILLENLRIDGRLILKLILKKQDGKVRTGFIWLGLAMRGGLL
jgi:hypothetical protein